MKTEEFRELGSLVRHDANLRRGARQRVDTECSGKHKFASRGDAARTLRGKDLKKAAGPYRCNTCKAWHIGSVAGKRNKRLLKMRRFGCESL